MRFTILPCNTIPCVGPSEEMWQDQGEKSLTASGCASAKSMATAPPRLGPTNIIGLFT